MNNEIGKLLNESVIGTPGSGMLYQHKSVEARIASIKAPSFIELHTKFGLVGTCCFCYRATRNIDRIYDSFYIRYFSFKKTFRAKSIPHERSRTGKLREEIEKLLQGRAMKVSSEKFFHYAYVDPRNTRSVLMCKEFGFREVRKFTTFIFSRLNPRIARGVEISKVRKEEIPEIKRLLLDRYAGFTMVSIEDLFRPDEYYVVRDPSGKVVVGAQVSPTHWRIYKMHNQASTILLSLLTRVPVLNRLVNKDFRFLAVDALFFTEGYEHFTETLLSFLLRKFRYFNAFIPSDNDSPLYRHLEKLNLGVVSKISKQVSTDVICRFQNFSDQEIDHFTQHPAYVSALDIT
ncbi:MAG TPA: hypothetical protein VFW11_22250 [Cyclobacteriaceae bacterium]|nr:hypothetical protein [Cyclobacteriaceae bacterium]